MIIDYNGATKAESVTTRCEAIIMYGDVDVSRRPCPGQRMLYAAIPIPEYGRRAAASVGPGAGRTGDDLWHVGRRGNPHRGTVGRPSVLHHRHDPACGCHRVLLAGVAGRLRRG